MTGCRLNGKNRGEKEWENIERVDKSYSMQQWHINASGVKKRCVEKIKPYLNFLLKFEPNVKMMEGDCLLNPNWELFDK